MTRVIAALDNSPTAVLVIGSARAAATVLGAEVDPVHVRVDGDAEARAVAAANGLELRLLAGAPGDVLVDEAGPADVGAIVVGARRLPACLHPIGKVARQVIASARAPVVVVPPHSRPSGRFHRVLVPLDGRPATAASLRDTVTLAAGHDIEIVVLHVYDEESVPAFDDQPQHEAEVWAAEFMARYVPILERAVRLELRVGIPADETLSAAAAAEADLIALGWGQEFGGGRARLVRAVLERSRIPVLLLPVARPVPAAPAPDRGSGARGPDPGRE